MNAQADCIDGLLQQATALYRAGDVLGAERVCRDAVRVNPDAAGAWHFLGAVRLATGDYAGAYTPLSRAVALCDTKPVYWNNLGVALVELGRHADAEAALERAIALHRDYADAWSNLGRVQLLHGDLEQSEKSLASALLLCPDHPQALVHLADVYRAEGRYEESVGVCERILAGGAQRPDVYKRLAQSLALLRRHDEAAAAVERGLRLAPGDAELQFSLGMIHAAREKTDEAKASFARAAALRPARAIWRWKHLAICPSVFPDTPSIDRYWAELQHGLAAALAEDIPLDWRTLPHDGFAPSFNLPHHFRCCREVKEQFARLFGKAFSVGFRSAKARPFAERKATTPARIGFLVTAGHENGFLRGMGQIIARLDGSRFEPLVFCVQSAAERVRKAVARPDLRVVPFLSRFDRTVETIRDAACDVMVYWKVGADTWNFFLPMARLAPIQCTSWGTHGTSGVEAIDYYLTSSLIEADASETDVRAHYTETPHLLPTLPTWQERQPWRQPCTRDEFGLPEQGALYFCPHRLPKYHPDFDLYLREILERDSSGCLAVLCGRPCQAQTLLQVRIARNLGETLSRRVFFIPAMPVEGYYQLLGLATVVLNSPAYAGGITAYDALSYDIPVVTQPGALAVQNYTAGLYRRMGIADLTARTREEYVAMAVRLGTDGDYRGDVVGRLHERSDAVFEDSEVVPAYERFFEEAMRVHAG